MPKCLYIHRQTPWIPPKNMGECDDTFSMSPLGQTDLGNSDSLLAFSVLQIVLAAHSILLAWLQGTVLVN